MSPRRFVRRTALGAMGLVTVASLWGWARPALGDHEADHRAAAKSVPSATAPAGRSSEAVRERAELREKGSTEAPESEPENEQPEPMNWADFGSKTPPFIAVLLNFAILAGGYYFVGRRPIGDALQSRRDSIANDIEEAERAKTAAEARAKVYQAKLEKLEDEVRAAREALVRAGEAERERIVSDAEAKAERLRNDAKFLIEQELKQARQDLWREAVDAAVAGARELLASHVTAADQERLAEDYLSSLGAQKGLKASDPQPGTEATS